MFSAFLPLCSCTFSVLPSTEISSVVPLCSAFVHLSPCTPALFNPSFLPACLPATPVISSTSSSSTSSNKSLVHYSLSLLLFYPNLYTLFSSCFSKTFYDNKPISWQKCSIVMCTGVCRPGHWKWIHLKLL